MSQPTEYNRQYNFDEYQALNPSDPLPGDQVDLEFNTVKITLDEISTNLALIQRDDGQLANDSVGPDQLTAEVSIGLAPPSTWTTATSYDERDTVFYGIKFYRALEDHVSGVFATDLAAEKWELIADFSYTTGDGLELTAANVLQLDDDMEAIEALSSTGLAARTATDTWALRTLTGTAAEITVANGNGVSGNPTISLPSALTFTGKTVTGGTFAGIAGLTTTGAMTPATNDAAALGSSSLMWSDLFLASGAVLNFNNGDVTLTHSADTLTLEGGTLVLPNAGLQIGASNPFSDSTGTLTLQNVDALDATTESTIEAAIDTLANLTSIQGHTVTLTGALIRSGAHSLTLTTSGVTDVTLPTTGTLATVAGSEALLNKTINGLTVSATTGTLMLTSGKTISFSNTLTFAGTDGTTMTFPTTTATIARTDAGQTFTGTNAFDKITFATTTTTDLTTDGAPDPSNDYIMVYDASAGVYKKVLVGVISAAASSGVTALGGQTGAITIAGGSLADTVLTVVRYDAAQSLSSGQTAQARANISAYDVVVARGYGEYTTHGSTGSTIPIDDTKPQNTEGVEILTAAITHLSTSNRVRCYVSVNLSNSTAGNPVAALFQSGSADAVQVWTEGVQTAGNTQSISYVVEFAVPATGSVTYTVRIGTNSGAIYLNGGSGGRFFGGASRCSLIVEEIRT